MLPSEPLPLSLKVGGPSPLEERYEGVSSIIVRTRIPSYKGVVYGIQFTEGQAEITPRTRNPLRLSLATLAARFQTDLEGYTVYAVYADGRIEPPLPEMDPAETDPYLSPDEAAARLSVQRSGGRAASAGLRAKVKE